MLIYFAFFDLPLWAHLLYWAIVALIVFAVFKALLYLAKRFLPEKTRSKLAELLSIRENKNLRWLVAAIFAYLLFSIFEQQITNLL